jgi:hypothetical protein
MSMVECLHGMPKALDLSLSTEKEKILLTDVNYLEKGQRYL